MKILILQQPKKKFKISLRDSRKKNRNRTDKILNAVKKEIQNKYDAIASKLDEDNIEMEKKESFGHLSFNEEKREGKLLVKKYQSYQKLLTKSLDKFDTKKKIKTQREITRKISQHQDMSNFLEKTIRPRIVSKRGNIPLFVFFLLISIGGGFIASYFLRQGLIWDIWSGIGLSIALCLSALILCVFSYSVSSIRKKKKQIEINALKGKYFSEVFAAEEIRENKIKNGFSSIGLWEGLVRGCIIIILIVLVGFFVAKSYNGLEVPIHLIVVLNLVLVYYGFKPSAILPQQLVIDAVLPEEDTKESSIDDKAVVGTTKKLIDNLPALKKSVTLVEDKFSDIMDSISKIIEEMDEKYEDLFKKISTILADVKKNLQAAINEAQKVVLSSKDKTELVKSAIDKVIKNISLTARNVVNSYTSQEQKDINGTLREFSNKLVVLEKGVNNNTNTISFLSTKFRTKPKHPVELSALLVLLLSIGILNLLYISEIDDPLTGISIAITLSFSAIVVATGVTVQELVFNTLQKKSKNTFNKSFREINMFKAETNSFAEDIRRWIEFLTTESESAVESIFQPVSNILAEVDTSLEILETKTIENIFQKANTVIDKIIENNPFKRAEIEMRKFQQDVLDRYNRFINRNFLSYFPADVAAYLSVGGLLCLSIIALLVPQTGLAETQEMGLNHPIFIGIEYIAAYYFTTKK